MSDDCFKMNMFEIGEKEIKQKVVLFDGIKKKNSTTRKGSSYNIKVGVLPNFKLRGKKIS